MPCFLPLISAGCGNESALAVMQAIRVTHARSLRFPVVTFGRWAQRVVGHDASPRTAAMQAKRIGFGALMQVQSYDSLSMDLIRCAAFLSAYHRREDSRTARSCPSKGTRGCAGSYHLDTFPHSRFLPTGSPYGRINI